MKIITQNTNQVKFKFLNRLSVRHYLTILFLITVIHSACKKFIEIDAPVTSTNAGNIYTADATAASVLTGIYTKMSFDDGNGFQIFGSGLPLMSYYPGLSSDELTLYSGISNEALLGYYRNNIKSNLTKSTDFWISIYSNLFTINSAIEGLNQSTSLTPAVKNQLLGEALFMRSFSYFYLVNLYGDVPLITTTDYTVTSLKSRTPKQEIYQQIVQDLTQSQTLLSDKYLDGTLLKVTTERVRPNKDAATALLARTYLYLNDWTNAEAEATKVISNKVSLDTVSLNDVFLKNSKETIWSLQTVNVGLNSNTGEGRLFILPGTGPSTIYPVYLNDLLVKSFESGDQRLDNWVSSVTVGGTKYYFAYKYKIGSVNTQAAEYVVVLRLGEQYLIRAEARAQQGNLSNAAADVNIIRNRAGLPPIAATTQGELLSAILHERQVELFTEWGHRWLDLKRTNSVNGVMPEVAQKKGGVWDNRWSLYPIPYDDMQRNPNLIQNPGYESN